MRQEMALACLLLIGCASRVPLAPPNQTAWSSPTETRQVSDRNYTTGLETSAWVGQPVVRVREYIVESTASSAFILPEPLTARARPFGPTRTFPAGTELRVVGSRTHDGAEYLALALPDRDFGIYPLLVSRDGVFSQLIHSVQQGYVFESSPKNIVEYTPLDLTLRRETKDHVKEGGAYTNFEIIYSGVGKDDLTLLYREYTPQDMARPAFTQNLLYDRTAEYVRFRDFRIRIVSADSEKLVYVVESDGTE